MASIQRQIRTAIITGPTGAIGMALCAKLLAEGVTVYAVTHPGSARAALLPQDARMHVVPCDAAELAALPELIPEKADAFFHFAWAHTIGPGRNDMPAQIENIRYTIAACRAAAQLGCQVFIGAGSQAEYGRVEGVLTAQTPCLPENGYGMAKLCAGQMSRVECQTLGVAHIWTRILSVYGPHDGPATMISGTIRKLLHGEKPALTAGIQQWDYLIQRLTIDLLHIIGDIYDRGPGAHIIMDTLCNYHNFDIQWGNHDILWMGAAAGNAGSIANVIRMCMRYGNLATLEDGYGINLLPLATFAMEVYGDDPCELFIPRTNASDATFDEKTTQLIARMHKAITIIQFKLEGEIIRRRPEFGMDDRLLLHHIDLHRGTIRIEGKEYELKDKNWPTLNAKDPYALSIEEEELMRRIKHSFECSEKLKKHMRCLFTHGSMYQVCNSNLLFHASVPMNPDGTLKAIRIEGTEYKGKALLDKVDQLVRTAYFDADDSPEKDFAMDYIWYLWEGKDSPLFDKSRMATFERCFIDDKSVQKEEKGAYYSLREEESVCDMLLDEFGVTGRHRHIINGHVPVRSIKGENPIKANGKLLVIDGGFSKAYHPETGIAGYTLVYHSRGFQLVQHEPFLSTDQAIKEGKDIRSTTIVVELNSHRQMVKDTDKGADLQQQIHDLEKLLYAFRNGFIKEKERYK